MKHYWRTLLILAVLPLAHANDEPPRLVGLINYARLQQAWFAFPSCHRGVALNIGEEMNGLKLLSIDSANATALIEYGRRRLCLGFYAFPAGGSAGGPISADDGTLRHRGNYNLGSETWADYLRQVLETPPPPGGSRSGTADELAGLRQLLRRQTDPEVRARIQQELNAYAAAPIQPTVALNEATPRIAAFAGEDTPAGP